MKTTYTVTAKSFDYKNLTVSFSDLHLNGAMAVAEMLGCGFRNIEVVCDQTGEVVYNHYKSPDWFVHIESEMTAIQKVVLFLAER
jgi:hypothetical protein